MPVPHGFSNGLKFQEIIIQVAKQNLDHPDISLTEFCIDAIMSIWITILGWDWVMDNAAVKFTRRRSIVNFLTRG